MRNILLLIFITSTFSVFSQTDITDYLEGRSFKNEQTGLVVKYGYISQLNTNGITFINSYGDKHYFMNCSTQKSTDNRFVVFTNCMNSETGNGVGKIVAYRNKIVIIASDGEMVYELID
jgi:hypothetical protein